MGDTNLLSAGIGMGHEDEYITTWSRYKYRYELTDEDTVEKKEKRKSDTFFIYQLLRNLDLIKGIKYSSAEDFNVFSLKRGGRLEYFDSFQELTTPRFYLKDSGSVDALVDSILAHRAIMSYTILRFNKREERKGLSKIEQSGWSSHESISLPEGVTDEKRALYLSQVVNYTIAPVLTALFKDNITSNFALYIRLRNSSRLELVAEYIPDADQLRAALTFFFCSMMGIYRATKPLLKGKTEYTKVNKSFLKKHLGMCVKTKAEKEKEFSEYYGIQIIGDKVFENIQEKGLDTRLDVMTPRGRKEYTLRDMMHHWLDVFYDEFAAYSSEQNKRLLREYISGSKRPLIEKGQTPYYFGIDQRYFRRYGIKNLLGFYRKIQEGKK